MFLKIYITMSIWIWMNRHRFTFQLFTNIHEATVRVYHKYPNGIIYVLQRYILIYNFYLITIISVYYVTTQYTRYLFYAFEINWETIWFSKHMHTQTINRKKINIYINLFTGTPHQYMLVNSRKVVYVVFMLYINLYIIALI